MVIDMHAHLWNGEYENDKAEILKAVDLFRISKVYVSGIGSCCPDETEVKNGNDEVYRFRKAHPDCIGGYCYINPLNRNCMDELQKGIEEYGMSGMKLWVATFCDDARVFPLVEKCIDYRVPVLIHSFYKAVGQLESESTALNVAHLARRYPEAKLMMAHLGGNCYHGLKTIAKYQNVSVDISGSPFPRDDVDYAVKMVGADRVLFGSDMPGSSFLLSDGQVKEADLTRNERNKIYYENALRLFDRTH